MIKEFILKIPKAELLVHIEGCLEPDLMLALAKRNKVDLPYSSVEDIKKAYQFSDLKSFLEIYYSGMKVLCQEQDFYDLTLSYLEKAAAQNVRHAEISFDPQAHLERGIQLETVLAGMHRAQLEAEKKFKISSHLIMCFMRELGVEDAEKILLKALEFKDWIVAIGLDSSEMNCPPEKFSQVFARAREYGFSTVASAGETGPAEYIWQAIDMLKVSRIAYGISCVQDPDLMGRLAMTRIPISVCPLSNVKLGIVKNMKQHPLKKMFDEGLCVTINSDDPAYFGAYINENMCAAQEALHLDKATIFEMAKNSFTASFLDHNQQQKFLNELDRFFVAATEAR